MTWHTVHGKIDEIESLFPAKAKKLRWLVSEIDTPDMAYQLIFQALNAWKKQIKEQS